jgi:hypothetical protein
MDRDNIMIIIILVLAIMTYYYIKNTTKVAIIIGSLITVYLIYRHFNPEEFEENKQMDPCNIPYNPTRPDDWKL